MISNNTLLLPFSFLSLSMSSQHQSSEEKVNRPGLDVSLLESKVQEKMEQSQQLRDEILKQQEALSRARRSLEDPTRAAGREVKRVLAAPPLPFPFSPFSSIYFSGKKNIVHASEPSPCSGDDLPGRYLEEYRVDHVDFPCNDFISFFTPDFNLIFPNLCPYRCYCPPQHNPNICLTL